MTGVSLCDVDHVPPERLPELLSKAKADPHTLLCYVTISGSGIRILFRYNLDAALPLESQKRFYRLAFDFGNRYYSELLGFETDGQCKDPVRLNALCHDPEVYFNAKAEKLEVTVAKSEKEKGNGKAKKLSVAEQIETIYQKICKKRLEEGGICFTSGSHNNYVMRIGYMMNDYGMPLPEVVKWARERFGADYPQAGNIVCQCYAAQPESFGKSAAVVKHLIGGKGAKGAKDDDGRGSQSVARVSDIEDYLDRSIVVKTDGLIEHPTFRFIDEDDSKFRIMTDFDVNSVWRRMARDLDMTVRKPDLYNVLESDYAVLFDPLIDYLNSLPTWTPDQPDYIAELAAMVTVEGGEKKQKLFQEYLRKWLVAMVAAWIEPQVINHEVLVLIGGQGVAKTAWFERLLPPELQEYYSPTLGIKNIDNRDEKLKISQRALISLEEIEKISEEVNTYLKSLITVNKTDIRAAYGRFSRLRGHRASFCGSGNNPQFLAEAVSRRWLPFVATEIVNPRDYPYNYTGIYSQVYHLYKTGFRYWFNMDEIKRLALHNRDFQETSIEEELIPIYFRKPGPNEVGQFFPNSLIMSYLPSSYKNQLSPARIGQAMKELGFEQKRTKNARGWICIPRTPAEIEAERKRLAMERDYIPEENDGIADDAEKSSDSAKNSEKNEDFEAKNQQKNAVSGDDAIQTDLSFDGDSVEKPESASDAEDSSDSAEPDKEDSVGDECDRGDES
jgi:predicted P-loop ATPase